MITGDILGERARLSPDAVALIHVPTRLQFTYAELNRRALQCARIWTNPIDSFGITQRLRDIVLRIQTY